MEIKYFGSADNKVFIKEENGLVSQIIIFFNDMSIDITDYEGENRCKRREHSRQFEIPEQEYNFWYDIAVRIRDFKIDR